MHTRTRVTQDARGFSLVELLVTMAITLVVMGATMTALGDAWKASESATLMTGLNSGLRVGMDLMVRDLLQVGQGLPTGRLITIPSGSGATPIRLPGPPGTTITLPSGTAALNAVIPLPGMGPVINNTPTDVIVTLAADSTFENRALTELTDTTMTVALNRPRQPLTGNPVVREAINNGANISDGGAGSADDIRPGDLIMLTRGSLSALVQVTAVSGQRITFATGDSLGLNQTAAADGTVREFRDLDPGTAVNNEVVSEPRGRLFSEATRIRMITYYVDAVTDPARPRLVRRMNNGNSNVTTAPFPWFTYNNSAAWAGTAVAFDAENLQISYDLGSGDVNPTDVKMTAAEMAPGGACGAEACDLERIRKVNVLLAARASRPMRVSQQVLRNSLFTQVSLRSLAFVDRYE